MMTHDRLIMKLYSLLHGNQSSQEITFRNNLFCGTTFYIMFCRCNNICALTGKLEFKTWKLNVHQLDIKYAMWEQVAFSKYSISDSLFNFHNCIPVSYREDRVILVSIRNDHNSSEHSIIFHVFTRRVSGRNWKTTSSLLPIQYTRNTEYRIKSSIVYSDHIYCSVMLDGIGAYIYKFDLISLQQNQKCSTGIKPVCHWHIREPSLQNCLLSVLKQDIVVISINSVDDKTILEVRRPMNLLPYLPADYHFEFPCKIKVVATSIISTSKIAVMCHDDTTNKCFINTFTI